MFKYFANIVMLILLIQPSFAKNKPDGVFIYLTNNLSVSGTVYIAGCRTPNPGPVVQKNGGTTEWIYHPNSNKPCFPAMSFKKNSAALCILSGRNITLDLSKYKHDTIFITYTHLSNDANNLECTCTGSACGLL